MKHFKVTFEPEARQVLVHSHATIIEAAGQAGIILNSVCGGAGTCGKCKVTLLPGGKQVLACQYVIEKDLTVEIPAESRLFEHKILEHGIDISEQIRQIVGEKHTTIAPARTIFGIAVDIGTTTIVAKLIDMTNGQCMATQAGLNPQTKFGDDVVTRIAYAATSEKLAQLQKITIEYINELVARLCRQTETDKNNIYEMCIVANTTMNHIFLNLPLESLGQAPYRAFSLDACDRPAAQMNIEINPDANIHTVENIAAFVGADITAVALAVDIGSDGQTTLVVDIGTNGEIVLSAGNRLYAASCAAGPAFEGARISCGSRAADGAIEAVIINENDIDLDVIGSLPPASICGSGIIDAVAVLLELGIINSTGRFVEPEKLKKHLPEKIFDRIIVQNSQPAFVLAHKNDKTKTQITLTQQDIRQVQLAKAAIRTGIKLLQQKLEVKDDDIDRLLLAGAFGNYIRRKSAVRIGMLPDIPHERIRCIGNAAAAGAHMILLSNRYRKRANQLARKIEYIEIAHETQFSDIYAESMFF